MVTISWVKVRTGFAFGVAFSSSFKLACRGFVGFQGKESNKHVFKSACYKQTLKGVQERKDTNER